MSNPPASPNGSLVTVHDPQGHADEETEGRRFPVGIAIGAAVVLIIVLVLVIGLIYLGLNAPDTTRAIRDVAIILMALMGSLIVVALVILIVLIARLTIMLQNEIGPLLVSIQETLNTIRGTAAFMSENVVQPVVKTAGYVEGARRFMEVLVGMRPRKKTNPEKLP